MQKTDMAEADRKIINNDYYHDLANKWYEASDDPIALLRAEGKVRNPWIASEIDKNFNSQKLQILDVGCGGGFLSNLLAQRGHFVTGVDLSESSLGVAKAKDTTQTVNYVLADAYKLPFADSSFKVVTSTDFLEHVSEPKKVIAEIARVLEPGGIFFFHTFNKNFLAHLFVIKGVEWFVKNTPKDLHVIDLFIKPADLKVWLSERGLQTQVMRGLKPKFFHKSFFNMLLTRTVDADFEFEWVKSTMLSYTGYAVKNHPAGDLK